MRRVDRGCIRTSERQADRVGWRSDQTHASRKINVALIAVRGAPLVLALSKTKK
jgi:hypothetical protein